jgi:hypothetical protein
MMWAGCKFIAHFLTLFLTTSSHSTIPKPRSRPLVEQIRYLLGRPTVNLDQVNFWITAIASNEERAFVFKIQFPLLQLRPRTRQTVLAIMSSSSV